MLCLMRFFRSKFLSVCATIKIVAILLLIVMQSAYSQGTQIRVKGLFKNSAVVEINGKQKVLRVGEKTLEGVQLISANSKRAIVEIAGKRRVLKLSDHIGAHFEPPEKSVIRIASSSRGHYFTAGRINNRPTTLLVDTGATTVAMSSRDAAELGVQYKNGRRVFVETASNKEIGYEVTLHQVAIGQISVNNVQAIVMEGSFPATILLGMSFLNQVDMKVDNGVLVLQTKY